MSKDRLGALVRTGLAALLLAGACVPPALTQQAPAPTPASPAKPVDKTPAPDPQGPPPAAASPGSSASDNAFPEDISRKAQHEAESEEKSDRDAAASGSAASGEEGSSSRDKLKGIDILGDHDARTSNGNGGTVLDPKLSKEDVRVGQLYMGDGNYQGAYQRFKEACAVNPGNTEAVFYLAEAARRAGHLDESAENYGLYLSVEPKGSKAKDAKKALKALQGK